MELKTKVHAAEGMQDLIITREFELPLELLFRAYSEPELIEQWMGTKVLKLDNKKYGGWHFETRDPKGTVVFEASGAIHEITPNRKIIRTFEMANLDLGVQLEITEFKKLSENTSKVVIHVIYESVAQRNQQLKLPFAQGINWAHNRLEKIIKDLNQ